MPKGKKPRNHAQLAEIARLKEEDLTYFEKLPVYRLAAYSIGRDEDTVLTWRKEDPDFAEKIRKAKAAWALKKATGTRVRDEFLLERLLKEDFAAKVEVEAKGPTAITFTYVLPPDPHQPDAEAAPDLAGAPRPDHH